MREILFRGKSLDTGEWKYGGVVHQTDFYGDPTERWFVIDGTTTQDYDIGFETEVIPDTVGQFTGLFDRAGKRIFEGDIIRHTDYDGVDNYAVVKYGKFNCSCCHGVYGWTFEAEAGNTSQGLDIRYCNPDRVWITDDDLEENFVVGNRWDNPELLKNYRRAEEGGAP